MARQTGVAIAWLALVTTGEAIESHTSAEHDHKNTGASGMKTTARSLIWFLAAVLLAAPTCTAAQEPKKVYRIGYLSPAPYIENNFRQRLSELGYIEGQNLVIEARLGIAKTELFPERATELVGLNVDLILAIGVSAVRAAKNATSTIPIVMGNSSSDPVRHGLVASLARPGGNVTGVIDVMAELAGKRLEVLKDTFPNLSRVAYFSPRGTVADHLERTRTAARALGIRLQAFEVESPDDLERAFQAAVDEGAEALIVVGVSFFIPHRKRIVNLEIESGLPAMHTHGRWVPLGGLMAYTTDRPARYRRAAEFVDKILRGRKPADLPVEQPTNFQLMINLKTAKQIGVTIPPNVLVRATRLIE